MPAAIGHFVASGFLSKNRLAVWLVGGTGAPTAWDAIFSADPSGYVLMRLKSGRWAGGEYADGSHVAGYPERPDIYLAQELLVDPQTEDFARQPGTEDPGKLGPYGLLVRWDEIEYLEIQGEPAREPESNQHDQPKPDEEDKEDYAP